MPKISVIGICGKSVFMQVDHFHAEGETLSASSVFEEMGGKGINQAIAAARMNADVTFLAAVGEDVYADECEALLKENNIKPFLCKKNGKATPLAFILTDKSGSNRVTVHKSAELSKEDVEFFKDEIISSDILLLQQEVPAVVNKEAIRIATENGVRVILNPAPAREIDDEDASKIYLVTPNEQEAQFIKDKPFKNCVTTLGEKGCIINGEISVPAIKVMPVDTTGAGDTFNGVLAVLIAENKEIEEACRYAVAASGLSVTKKYVIGSIPTREEIERSFKNE